MLSTYITIGQAIRKEVPSVRWVALDKGQLDDPDSFNSLLIPSVLIGMAEIVWSQLGGGYQQGQGQITVKTIIRLPAETHLDDPLSSENLKALTLADSVRTAVLSVPGVSSRLTTKEYPVLTYYVVEETFAALFTAGPSLVKKQVHTKINPFLSKPSAQA